MWFVRMWIVLVILYTLCNFIGVQGQAVLQNGESFGQQCQYADGDGECLTNEIIGGDQESPKRFPYIVSLQIMKDRVNDCYHHFCGATLIAPDVVLTAAHCIQEVSPVNKRQGILSLPVYAALAPRCRHFQSGILNALPRVKLSYFILHPEYTRVTLENDLAVVKLEIPLAPNGPFAPYKLSGEYAGLESSLLDVNYDSLSVIGYGDTSSYEAQTKDYNSRLLRRARIRYLADIPCENMLQETNSQRKLVPELMMCAFNETADACSGDSGGPLVVTGLGLEPGLDGDYTTDLQVGIVSWGPGDACQNKERQYVGVYTQLDRYIGWIDDAIQQLDSSVSSDLSSQQDNNGNSQVGGQCETELGCYCKQFWQYQGRSYTECDNPDQDPSGNWCIVDVRDCANPAGSISITGEFWDSCSCKKEQLDAAKSDQLDCPSTVSGCKCESTWQHSGQPYQGCENPDNDQQGSWCYIQGDFSSCSNAGFVDPETRIVSNVEGQLLSYFDYCKEECQ